MFLSLNHQALIKFAGPKTEKVNGLGDRDKRTGRFKAIREEPLLSFLLVVGYKYNSYCKVYLLTIMILLT